MAQIKAVVDKLLTNVSNAYFPKNLIADKILPPLQVDEDTGILGGYGKAHLRIESSVVGGRGRARRVEPILIKTDNTYFIKAHELQGEVTGADYRNKSLPFDAEKDEVLGLTTLLSLEKEYILARTLQNEALITNYSALAGNSKFSDYNNSNPIKLFKDIQNNALDSCGTEFNAVTMSKKVFNTLKYHPQILANLGYSMNRAGKLTEKEIAEVIGVEKLFIGDAAYNSAKEGQADVMTQVWGNHMTFGVCPDKAEKYQTSLGYYIKRSGEASRRVKKWQIDDSFENTGILVGDNYQFRVTDVTAAYLLKDVI